MFYPYCFPVACPLYPFPLNPWGWLWPGLGADRGTRDFWWRYLSGKRSATA